jgi:hypothetical protein
MDSASLHPDLNKANAANLVFRYEHIGMIGSQVTCTAPFAYLDQTDPRRHSSATHRRWRLHALINPCLSAVRDSTISTGGNTCEELLRSLFSALDRRI